MTSRSRWPWAYLLARATAWSRVVAAISEAAQGQLLGAGVEAGRADTGDVCELYSLFQPSCSFHEGTLEFDAVKKGADLAAGAPSIFTS